MWTFHLYVATFQQDLHTEYISARYSSACGTYHDFLDSALLPTRNRLNKCSKVKLSLLTFNGDRVSWLIGMEYLCSKWPPICSSRRNHNSVLSSFMTSHLMFNKSNTTGTTSEEGTAYLPEGRELTPMFYRSWCYSLFSVWCSIFSNISFVIFTLFHCITCPSWNYGFW